MEKSKLEILVALAKVGGKTRKELADAVGVNISTVDRSLRPFIIMGMVPPVERLGGGRGQVNGFHRGEAPSEKNLRVLRLLDAGRSNRDAANELGVSVHIIAGIARHAEERGWLKVERRLVWSPDDTTNSG